MRLLKDALLLSKYPPWNSKMLNRISFYSFLFFILLGMTIGFLKTDLGKRYEAMPDNTFINSLSHEENFSNIDSYTASLKAKGSIMEQTLNTKIQIDYSFITSSYFRKDKNSRTTMYRCIYSTDPKAYIQTINNLALNVLDFDNHTPGVLISEALALEWFGTTSITKKSIFLTNSTFGTVTIETPILGVYTATACKSILFDSATDQVTSLDETILATMALANQVESAIPFGEIVLSEMYKLNKPITSKEYTSILEMFPLIQCKYYAVNQYFLMVEPLFTLIFTIFISFFILSTFLLILIQILRWIDIKPILDIERIYYIKKLSLINKIFLSSIIKVIRDFIILSLIYLLINSILYLSIGYFIPIEPNLGIMLAGMLGVPILASMFGTIYFCNSRLTPR